MNNNGTSLNFDAQAMYLEEENQLEAEENQRENELKALLSNAFADMIDEDDDEEEEEYDEDDEGSSSPDISTYHNNAKHPHAHLQHAAYHHQMVKQQQQHYSTPAGNQLIPQLALQATLIPTDDTIMYQNGAMNRHEPPDQIDEMLAHQETHIGASDSFKLHLDNDTNLADMTPNNPVVVEYAPPPPAHNHNLHQFGADEPETDATDFTNAQFMNMDDMHKKYGRLNLLYTVRGKKLEEVTGKFEAYQEDMKREIRQMTHRILLAEKEKESAQMSLEQSNALVAQCKHDIDALNMHTKELDTEIERLKSVNAALNEKVAHCNDEIENLNYQLAEQQKCDSIDRLKQQHEQVVQSLRDTFENELFAANEQRAHMQLELAEKHNLCELLKSELDKAAKAAEQAFIERSDTVQRLSKKLQDVQKQYDEMVLAPRESGGAEKDAVIAQMNERVRELEEQVKLHEAMQLCASGISEASELNASQQQGENLKKELERALNALKVKRGEIQRCQAEIQRLKSERTLGAATASPSQFVTNAQKEMVEKERVFEALNEELVAVKAMLEEVAKEKGEMAEDVAELKMKLEQYHAMEDEFGAARSALQNEIFVKNEQIEGLLLKQHELESGSEQRLAMVAKYEGEISALKMQIEASSVEITKVKQLYLEVCNERNEIEVRLKEAFDAEMRTRADELQMEVSRKEMLVVAKQEAFAQLTARFDEMKGRNEAMETELARLKANAKESEAAEVELKELRTENERLRTDINGLKSGKMKEVELNEDKLKDTEAKLKETEAKLKENEAKLKESEGKLKGLRDENENLLKKISEMETNKMQSVNEQLKELKELKERLAGLNKENGELKQMQDKLNLELIGESRAHKELQDDFSRVNAECDKLRTLNKRLEASLGDVEQLNRLNESNLVSKMKKIEAENEEMRTKIENINQLNEFLSKESDALKRDLEAAKGHGEARDECERLRGELAESSARYQAELSQVRAQSDENCRKMCRDLEMKLSEELAKINRAKQSIEASFKAREDELVAENGRLRAALEAEKVRCADLAMKFDAEKTQLVARKDEELQAQISALETRFETDYSRFLATNKENLAKTLQEKNDEFSREKELYEAKLRELETREAVLGKQIKELKKQVDVSGNTIDVSDRMQLPAHYSPVVKEEIEKMATEREQLLRQIKAQEELINNADEHFEHELEKLRIEYEEEYRAKLETEIMRMQMDAVEVKRSERLTSKYEHELSLRDKKLETIEQAYQSRVEEYQRELQEWERKMAAMSQKHEVDVARLRKEIDEQYKAAVGRLRHDNEGLQNFVQKLKKNNADTDRVIENLKEEMRKMQASHLDELSNMKLGFERDKEAMSQRCEQLVGKLQKAEKMQVDADERFRGEVEAVKARLKEEYGAELSRMNAKMKEMMKRHADAVALLKKQHTAEKVRVGVAEEKSVKAATYSTNSQTECTLKDLTMLEAFKDKYLETLSKMKNDLMRQFDEQTLRCTDKMKRELEDERKRLIEGMRGVVNKKLGKILREYHVSETLIKTAINEFEFEIMNLAVPGGSFETVARDTVARTRPLSAHSSSAVDVVARSPNVSTRQRENYAQIKRIEQEMADDVVSVHSSAEQPQSNYVRRFKTNETARGSVHSSVNEGEFARDLQPFVSSPSLSGRVNSSRGNGVITPSKLSENDGPDAAGSKVTGSSYKYTPLRQSWSNLSQVNQLSPLNIDEQNLQVSTHQLNRANSPFSHVEKPKERPSSASNLLYRVNNSASNLVESHSTKTTARSSEHDIISSIHAMEMNSPAMSPASQVRSFSSTAANLRNPSTSTTVNAPVRATSPEMANKFSSLPRNASQAGLKGAANSAATLPSRPASTTNAMFGLSVFKDKKSGEMADGARSRVLTNITTSRTKASLHHQFEDSYPVKELDMSVSTVSSTVTNFHHRATGVQSEYQVPIRSPTAQIMSGSYRGGDAESTSEASKSKSQSQSVAKTSSYKPAVSESGSRGTNAISKLTEKFNFQKKKQIFS